MSEHEDSTHADELRGQLFDSAILVVMGLIGLTVGFVVDAWSSSLGLAATALILAVLLIVVVRAGLTARRLRRLMRSTTTEASTEGSER